MDGVAATSRGSRATVRTAWVGRGQSVHPIPGPLRASGVLVVCAVCGHVEAQPTVTPGVGLYVAKSAEPSPEREWRDALKAVEVLPQCGIAVAWAFAQGEAALAACPPIFSPTKPSGASLRRSEPTPSSDEQPLRRLATRCRAKGIEFVAYFNLLQWGCPGQRHSGRVFPHNPDLQELNADQSLRRMVGAEYASPWSPVVAATLRHLIASFTEAIPEAAGVLFDSHLSHGEILGYSKAARTAYINARAIDPLDISLGSQDENAERLAREWCLWREEEMARFVGELAEAYRSARPGGKVYGMGHANYYRWPLGRRNYLLNNWLLWAKQGSIEGVFLEDDWASKENELLYSATAELCQKEGVELPLYPVVSVSAKTTPQQVKAAVDAIGSNPAPPMIVYKVDSEHALWRLSWLLARAGVAPTGGGSPLLAQAVADGPGEEAGTDILTGDLRLYRSVTVPSDPVAVGSLLETLSKALDLKLAVEEVGAQRLSIPWENRPAIGLLRLIAQKTQAKWELLPEGYLLAEPPDPDRAEGDRLLAEKDLKGAKAAYDRAVKKGRNVSKAWFGIGQALMLEKDYKAAVEALSKALAADPFFKKPLAELGHCHRYLGNHTMAVDCYREFLSAYPDDFWGQLGMGAARLSLRQWDEAVAALLGAAKKESDNAQPHLLLAEAYKGKGDLKGCIAAWAKVVELQPKSSRGYMGLGRALMQAGRFDAAVAAFNQALTKEPEDLEAHLELGNCLRFAAKHEQAVRAYQSFLKGNPKAYWGLVGIGASLVALGKAAEARPYLEDATKLYPKEAWGHYYLAKALLSLGDRKAAVAAAQQAASLEPHNREARELLEKMPKGK